MPILFFDYFYPNKKVKLFWEPALNWDFIGFQANMLSIFFWNRLLGPRYKYHHMFDDDVFAVLAEPRTLSKYHK